MEWNLKAPAWDLSEFVQGSSSLGDNKIRGDNVSIDLKLGLVDKCKEPRLAQFGSGSLKRSRSAAKANSGTQIASCLVDGCTSDLSNGREYHRRHKVCEQHSKTPIVTIRGHKQRFCQQCSRFQSLEEFDEGKRSCRKRLDGHNRRRRKPQPGHISCTGSFMFNVQGSQFSNKQVYPWTNVMNIDSMWTGATSSSDEDAGLYSKNQQLNKQFTVTALQGHNLVLNRLTNGVPYEDCALSLLSSPPQTLGISLVSTPLAPTGSVLAPSGRGAEIHYPPSLHHEIESSVPQTLPFHWEW